LTHTGLVALESATVCRTDAQAFPDFSVSQI